MARRRHPHSIEHNILITATLCLLAAGAVMVFSASSARSLLSGQGDGTTFLIRYVGYGAVGVVLMQIIARRGLEIVPRLTGPLLIGSFVALVLVKLPGFGVSVNGARRWLGAGPLVFQPSEVMKLALVLYAAKLLAERPKVLHRWQNLGPLGLVAGGAVLLVASQPDLGTALVICFTMAAMLVAAGMPVRWLATAGGVGGVMVLLYAMSASYRRDRLMTFLDPWAHAGNEGFQSVQGQIAIGSGGLFGRGLGQSLQKNLFLPEAHTDFILAIIGEELGVVGICGVLFLYGLVAYAGLRVARNARGTYAKLLAAGVTSLFLSQAMLNVFTVLGLAPLTGVPLPFISYGSTNLIVLLLGMGLLLNVAAGGNVKLQAVPDVSGSRRDGSHDRDRRRRDSRARGAGAGGGRRAAG
ncbi:putative lipid II flippase FtsW [Baekduia soli]|uniref:Probable peptidoglycan glycosyltransferase FtsW n=1 Tax=Baekduia soli TaxID=496014 RepID=A0A5B8U6S0_9ACTN|nr:putative lipid II flippase FtsW [Baekduia soli]QEC48605.1 putative lipid II flippase FtsW [Baekduia soli]